MLASENFQVVMTRKSVRKHSFLRMPEIKVISEHPLRKPANTPELAPLGSWLSETIVSGLD